MRRSVLRAVSFAIMTAMLIAATAWSDPLPAWNDTAPKRTIIASVEKVTEEGSPEYIPPVLFASGVGAGDQAANQQTSGEEQAVQDSEATPSKTGSTGVEHLPWHGPLFILMTRLTAAASDSGSDTPPKRARLEINNYYQKQAQSGKPGGQREKNQQVLRMDFPMTSKFTFRIDAPYVWQNGDANGLGDIFSRFTCRILDRPGLTFLALFDSYYPSGAQPVTQGKFQAGPGFEVRLPVGALHSVMKFRLQDYFSYAGNSSYTSINYMQTQGRFYTRWSENCWSELRFYLISNWEKTADTPRGYTSSKVELEAGRKVGEHLRFYVRPGVGLWGVGQPNVYDWAFRAGLYYLF